MESSAEHQPAIDAPPPTDAPPPSDAPPWGSPAAADDAAPYDAFAQRPEVYVGAAFAGGLVLAGMLRFLGR